jgi:hypothetical protein
VPQLLYASGFLFMGATEEQMHLLSDANVTHVSYILILYSVAFLLYLFVNVLSYVYASSAWPDDETNGLEDPGLRGGPDHGRNRALSVAGPSDSGPGHARKISTLPNGVANGSARLPKHRGTASQQVRDAEEFELEGLISDGEGEGEGDAESPVVGKREGGVQLA